MEIIMNQTKSTISKGLLHFAKQASLQPREVQFVIYQEGGVIKYKLLNNYDEIREITFKEILNVKIDFLNQGLIANNFLLDCFKRLARENKCTDADIELTVFTNDNEKATSIITLYVGGKEIEDLSYKQIFGITEDVIQN